LWGTFCIYFFYRMCGIIHLARKSLQNTPFKGLR
jgi:hypothetical protein